MRSAFPCRTPTELPSDQPQRGVSPEALLDHHAASAAQEKRFFGDGPK